MSRADRLKEKLVTAMAAEVHEAIVSVYATANMRDLFDNRGEVKLSLYDTDSAPMEVQYNNHSVAFTMPHLLEIGEATAKKGDEEADRDTILRDGLRYAVKMLMLKKRDVREVPDSEHFQIDIGDGIPEEDKQAIEGASSRAKRSVGQNAVYNIPLSQIKGFPRGITVMTAEESKQEDGGEIKDGETKETDKDTQENLSA